MENNKVKRGEIYYYDFGYAEGSVQSGLRPVLIVQSDEGNRASTMTVVAPITTAKMRYLPSHIYLNEDCVLKKSSMVLLEQLKTVNQSDLLEKVGCITDEYIKRLINNGLKKALGLWIYKKPNPESIRCLCGRCLEDYKLNKGIIVRRLNPYERVKEHCDKCNGMGYEYSITVKSRSRGNVNGRK